jgi:hypothetical protein
MKKTLIAALLAASCIPAVASSYYIVVPVPNRTPTTGNIVVTLNPSGLPTGVVGRAYAGYDFNTLLQVKGDPNFNLDSVRWTVVGGALPAGLALSAYGRLAGTPTAPASASFQVMATYKTKTGQQAYQVLVGDVTVALAGATLPAGVQGAAYSFDLKPYLSVAGDPQYTQAQVTWTYRGTLPAGVTLKTDGTISGVPTEGGTSSFDILATYLGKSGSRTYEVLVGEITVSLATATPPAGAIGQAYTGFDLKPRLAVSGDAAYSGAGVTWSIASGALPDGLALDASTGVIAGTPSAHNTSPVTVKAAYKSKFATQAYTFAFSDAVKQYAGYRAWSNGALAASCREYRNPSGNYSYQGSTGDGVYRIKPGSSAVDVYCDMTTDGGGWTLVMTNNLPNFTNMAGTGTANVCTTITGCNTGGTSSFYLNTPVENTITEMMMTATSTGNPYDMRWRLLNPPNFVRDTTPAPGITLFRLMTDTTPGWAPLSQESVTEGGDRNDPSRAFRGTAGTWSDGNWHGAGFSGQEGMQIRWTGGAEWGHHHFTPTTFDGTNYVIGGWTYLPFFGGGTAASVPKAAAENLYRWTIFVR